ncbi:hypothetical protein P0202_22110 [Escherichia coli]
MTIAVLAVTAFVTLMFVGVIMGKSIDKLEGKQLPKKSLRKVKKTNEWEKN